MAYNKVAIITCKPDPASCNIKARLLEMFPFKETQEEFDAEKVYALGDYKIYSPNKHPIECEHLDKEIEADLFCFATKHKAASGRPSLSVHVPGNFGTAELGGVQGKICVCPASVIRTAFLELSKFGVGTEHEITLEATHHGPLIDRPCFFIEIGSDESQWSVPANGKVIAQAIMNSLEKRNEVFPTVVVLGGGHYSQLGNKLLQRTHYAVGHICAKHSLANLDLGLLNQMIDRDVERVETVVLDWKGLGDQKEKLKELEKQSSVKFVRSKEILHNGD